jgi:hypothetical protein
MASSLPLVAVLVAGVLTTEVLLGGSLGVVVVVAKICGNRITPLFYSDLPSPPFAPSSSSCLQDLSSSDPSPPTPSSASPSVKAATRYTDLVYKQHSYLWRCLDDLVPPDLDLELLLQPSATTINKFFSHPMCASKAPSIHLQPSGCMHLGRLYRRSPASSSSIASLQLLHFLSSS